MFISFLFFTSSFVHLFHLLSKSEEVDSSNLFQFHCYFDFKVIFSGIQYGQYPSDSFKYFVVIKTHSIMKNRVASLLISH